jgi:hypothetical protein
MDQVAKILKENIKHSDVAAIQRQIPKYNYAKVRRHLMGECEPDPEIISVAMKFFKERRRKKESLILKLKNI